MQEKHEKHESKRMRKMERKMERKVVPYKKAASKVMPCMYKQKGKRDAS